MQAPEVFAGIVAATHARVPIIALVNDAGEYRLAKSVLENGDVPLELIRFADEDGRWKMEDGRWVWLRRSKMLVLPAP